MADFYQILGVSRDADADTLKRPIENKQDNTILMLIKNLVPKINLKRLVKLTKH